MTRGGRAGVGLALLLACAALAGCASVPDSSTVQILRRVTGGETSVLPAGPIDGSDPGELVRGFVGASGSSADRHGAARRFLTPDAAGSWDDAAGFTVLDSQFDTVPAPDANALGPDRTRIRIRGTAVGQLTPEGCFEPASTPVQLDVTLARVDGQWLVSEPPAGVLVPLVAFRENYRPVRTRFVDPIRQLAVSDLRYVPTSPQGAQAARVLELLLAGSSDALSGAVTSAIPAEARLRTNVGVGQGGELVVDLTGIGDPDPATRRLIAAQVVLSLAEVSVARVRLLADGIPLLPDLPQLTRDDVADLTADSLPGADVPGLVAAGGRLRGLTGLLAGTDVLGPAGDGSFDVESAASDVAGQQLAVVARSAGQRLLLVGGGSDGRIVEVGLRAAQMTRPTWTPTASEVWTVLDSTAVARVLIDAGGAARQGEVNADELAAIGPITDLRLSRDGMRVAAVVGGALYTGAVARTTDGEAAIRNVRLLGPVELGEVVAVDWRAADSITVITGRPDGLVAEVSVDGLSVRSLLVNNLTPPLTAVAAAPNRPTLVADQNGVWSFAGGQQDAWRQVLGGTTGAVPIYPG